MSTVKNAEKGTPVDERVPQDTHVDPSAPDKTPPLLQEVAGRWRASGLPSNLVQGIELGTPDAVLQAFDQAVTTLSTSQEVLQDLLSVVRAGVVYSDVSFIWQESQGAFSRLVRRGQAGRETTATAELVRIVCGLPIETEPDCIQAIVHELLSDPEKLGSSRYAEVVAFGAQSLPNASTMFAKLLVDLAGKSSSLDGGRSDKLAAALCTTAERITTSTAPAHQAARCAIFECFWRMSVTLGPALRKPTPLAEVFRERVFPLLIRAAVSPGRPQQLAVSTFVVVLTTSRDQYATGIGSFIQAALVPTLRPSTVGSSAEREAAAASLLDELRGVVAEAQHLVDLFSNFDCSPERQAVALPLWHAVCDAARSSPSETVRRKALFCVVAGLTAFGQWMDRFEDATSAAPADSERADEGSQTPPPAGLAAGIQTKKAIEFAIREFNRGYPDACFGALQEHSLVTDRESFGRWVLGHNNVLSKLAIGEHFGKLKPERTKCLEGFTNAHDFSNMTIDEALRTFLGGFKLLGEAQVVDKTMSIFAAKYAADNPGAFRTQNTAFILSFSICMLNTDAHSPHIDTKMSAAEFIRNNAGIDEGEDVPKDVLAGVFQRVSATEFKLRLGPADHAAAAVAASAAAHRASSGSSGIPLLRHLAPVLGAVTDAVLLPVELAAHVTGISGAQDKKRASAEQARELQSLVADAIAHLKAVSRTSGHSEAVLSAASSVEYIVPLIHACADAAADALASVIRSANVSDEEFDTALSGGKVGMQVCARVGLAGQAIRLVAEVNSRASEVVAGSSAAPRAVAALRTLYEMVLGGSGGAPIEAWQILWRAHLQLLRAELLPAAVDPTRSVSCQGSEAQADGSESPAPRASEGVSPTTKQGATKWFGRREGSANQRRTHSDDHWRQSVQGAVSRATVAKLRDIASVHEPGRTAMLVALLGSVAELGSTKQATPEIVALVPHYVKDAVKRCTRLQWHAVWQPTQRALEKMPKTKAMRAACVAAASEVAEAVLARDDFADNEHADALRLVERIAGSQLTPTEVKRISGIVQGDAFKTLVIGSWKVLLRMLSRTALSPETVGIGAAVALSWAKQVASGNVRPDTAVLGQEMLSCLLGFACTPHETDVQLPVIEASEDLAWKACPGHDAMELFVSVGTSGSISDPVKQAAVRSAIRLVGTIADADEARRAVAALATRIASAATLREEVGAAFVSALWAHGTNAPCPLIGAAYRAWCGTAPNATAVWCEVTGVAFKTSDATAADADPGVSVSDGDTAAFNDFAEALCSVPFASCKAAREAAVLVNHAVARLPTTPTLPAALAAVVAPAEVDPAATASDANAVFVASLDGPVASQVPMAAAMLRVQGELAALRAADVSAGRGLLSLQCLRMLGGALPDVLKSGMADLKPNELLQLPSEREIVAWIASVRQGTEGAESWMPPDLLQSQDHLQALRQVLRQ